ncbi:NAD(P)H-hydrate dehydratase [Fulvivirga sp. 29W222]|uniref:Bifunctional NAD(P)H-hydrate repair enzyme n=1 Tax=Fulvivirga marina TaxID=2494733 RepID=A0A937G292_9BACT|nr:NAD(P)H-hydrate dehydratase [Fulvivirga marina]MBL6447131.1 NAD(P)H-hydrate dehydratase [Fulvivirga marina]
MKVLSANQIRNVDNFTIKNEPIRSVDLMERAAKEFTRWFTTRFSPKYQIAIVCGTGNNGGDGLAIARILYEKNYKVEAYVIRKSGSASDDFKINEKRLGGLVDLIEIRSSDGVPEFSPYHIIIDGIFGSGLTREVEGLYADVIEAINYSDNIKVSIDIASGLFSDRHTCSGAIVRPEYTVSFQIPKQAFFMPENAEYVGEWHIVDIGLMAEAIDKESTSYFMLTNESVRGLLKERTKFSHKGTYGRALIMAGSYGKMGAAVLCAKAALRAGVGLLTMNIPACGYDIMQSTVPEAMVLPDEGDHYLTSYGDVAQYDALGIGPGLGKEQETVYSLMQAIQVFGRPLVIDADGLNIISEHREILEVLPPDTILTPHPKEFERLAGSWSNDFERLKKQVAFAKEHKVIVVLKGAHTSITFPTGEVYFNSSGNPGMASGGSGDVLTGMITSLLAQKYLPENAAKVGVYLHGVAGDLAAEVTGQTGMIASDLIDFIPDAYQNIR